LFYLDFFDVTVANSKFNFFFVGALGTSPNFPLCIGFHSLFFPFIIEVLLIFEEHPEISNFFVVLVFWSLHYPKARLLIVPLFSFFFSWGVL